MKFSCPVIIDKFAHAEPHPRFARPFPLLPREVSLYESSIGHRYSSIHSANHSYICHFNWCQGYVTHQWTKILTATLCNKSPSIEQCWSPRSPLDESRGGSSVMAGFRGFEAFHVSMISTISMLMVIKWGWYLVLHVGFYDDWCEAWETNCTASNLCNLISTISWRSISYSVAALAGGLDQTHTWNRKTIQCFFQTEKYNSWSHCMLLLNK